MLKIRKMKIKAKPSKNSLLFTLLLLAGASVPVHAQVGVALHAGSGSDGDIAGLAVISHQDFWTHSFQNGWAVRTHLESSLTQISGKGTNGRDLVVLGVTPMVRFEPKSSPGFIEVGIGANYFDKKNLNDQKSVGTHFEFGDIIGVGFKFGGQKQHEIGYRFIHYSNAGISSNNPGVDFHMLRLKTSF